MPKNYTFPILINETTYLSISNLNKWGYLKPGMLQGGTVRWSREGNETASIVITLNTYENPWCIYLTYNFEGKPIESKIRLELIHSNLGKGFVPYFVCPVTSKRCRKLFLCNGIFVHREAIKGALYDCQTYSHKHRNLFKQFALAFGTEGLYQEIYSKGFKRYYRGKPTRRFLRLKRQIERFHKFEE